MNSENFLQRKIEKKTPRDKVNKLISEIQKNNNHRLKYSITATKNNNYKTNSYGGSFPIGKMKNFSNDNIGNILSISNQNRRNSINFGKENNSKNRRKSLFKIKNVHFIDNSNDKFNSIENNIKQVLNNMKIEIKKEEEAIIVPPIKQMRKTSTPNIKFYCPKTKSKKSRKRSMRSSSSFIEEYNCNEMNFSFKEKKIKKRSNSFDLNELTKKKIIKSLKYMINKRSSIKHLNNNISDNSSDDDSDENNKKSTGYAIHPNSNFIYTFDLILILVTLFYFIFIPLKIAKNKEIIQNISTAKEILYFFVDFIFLFDFIISFFKGYYNFEMQLVTNNKEIIFHYLKKYFISDLLEALPIYSIVRVSINSNYIEYYANIDLTKKLITLLLILKPFKIIKIIGRKQNLALENAYSYLSENYFLEKAFRFIIYLLIYFLFLHLLICLHLYLSFCSYPNWIIYNNLMNAAFFEKYITSFYFMVTTITTVGYGDIICISFVERLYYIILLVLGTSLYTFLVRKLGNHLKNQSHEHIKLNNDLAILENIRITYPEMPFKLYTKIKNHLLSIYRKRKKVGISLLLNGVPDAIKNALLFKIYSNVINGFNIFKNVKNSNFVVQVLTNFIPIISKKEDIIILEGEVVQNIVFIKDGRLALEIVIDLNEPLKSIQKYLEINFEGISKQEELKNCNALNRKKSVMTMENKANFNDLKKEIENKILVNRKTNEFNDCQIVQQGISVDLGRIDFSMDENDKLDDKKFKIIKIMDIRKNEHFGDVHLLSEQPSPFTVKAKSRIAELFLLRKYDASIISKTYPNIWRRIYNKSFHNLVSIKKVAFKALKRYYNTHYYNKKNNKEESLSFNIDMSKNGISFNDVSINKIKNSRDNSSQKYFFNYSSGSSNSISNDNSEVKSQIKDSKHSNSTKEDNIKIIKASSSNESEELKGNKIFRSKHSDKNGLNHCNENNNNTVKLVNITNNFEIQIL